MFVCGIPVLPSYDFYSHFVLKVHLPILLLFSPVLASASVLSIVLKTFYSLFLPQGLTLSLSLNQWSHWPSFLHCQHSKLRFWAPHLYWTCHCSNRIPVTPAWGRFSGIISSCWRGQTFPFGLNLLYDHLDEPLAAMWPLGFQMCSGNGLMFLSVLFC